MLSAASCPFPLNSVAASRWREVQLLQRHACMLRAGGKTAEAFKLESGPLVEAVAALRECSTVTQAQLDWLFAAEEERVTSVHLLAEILVPMLTEAVATLAKTNAAAAAASAPTARASNSPLSSSPPGAPASSPASANTSPGIPGIADFIDEMLSQERAPRSRRSS